MVTLILLYLDVERGSPGSTKVSWEPDPERSLYLIPNPSAARGGI